MKSARRPRREPPSGRREERTWIGVFTVQTERVVAKDNTVTIAERNWQLGEEPISQFAGWMHGHGPRAPRWSRVDPVWSARGGPVQRKGRGEQKGEGRGKAAAGFPLSHRPGDDYPCSTEPKTPIRKPPRGLSSPWRNPENSRSAIRASEGLRAMLRLRKLDHDGLWVSECL